MSPVGPYYASGRKPVSLLASTEHVRAFPGGTGAHKLGLNYAGGIVPQAQAAKLGYHQILWLLGERHMLTEVSYERVGNYWGLHTDPSTPNRSA